MKKIIFSGIAVFMLLLLATGALGASLSFDIMNNGETRLNDSKIDTEQSLIRVTIPVNDFQFGLEYTHGKVLLSNSDVDFTLGAVKAGYTLFNAQPVKLIANLGYCYGEVDYQSSKLKSGLVGVAGTIQLTGRTSLDLIADWGFSGSYELASPQQDMDPLFQYQAKLNFQLDPNLGFTVGYRCLQLERTGKSTTGGLTVGASFLF